MRIRNVEELRMYKEVIKQCQGEVWLERTDGVKYNLKNTLELYTTFADLITGNGEDFELFCANPNDELLFYPLFKKGII